MSTDTSRDVSLIQDEDVLRKMWQETEDFGRKKEIRSHMYKLREARLRDFYNTGEATTQTKQTSSTIRETTSKGHDISTHADSLADHSFLSLKSKEIRDSESPTRDVSYKITGPSRMIDQGWNVVTSDEKSADGKTHSTSRIATTSGVQPIEGGISNYAAKSEQKASVFRDGDDKNYTKSAGATSQNVINQEASGGDENSKFHTSYTSKSTSSKHSSEQRFTSGDDHPTYITDKSNVDYNVPSNIQSSVVHKTYTTDAPNEFKIHPGYVEGKTKVITETKTLPDGSTVTTTRYETKDGKTTSSSSSTSYSTSSKQVSSSEQKASSVSNVTKSHQTIQDSKNLYNDDGKVRIIKYINQPDVETEITTTRNGNVDVGQNFTSSTSSTVRSVTNQFANDSKTANINVIRENFVDNKEITRINDAKLIGRDVHDVKTTREEAHKKIDDVRRTNRDEITTVRHDVNQKIDDVCRTNRDEITTIRHDVPVKQHETTITKTTVVKNVYDDQKAVSDDFINVERHHVRDTKLPAKPKEIEPKRTETINVEVEYVTKGPSKPKFDDVRPNEMAPSPANYEPERPQVVTPVKPNETCEPASKYEPQERRQPIRPTKSEFEEARPNEINEPKSPTKYEPQERRQPIKPPKSEFDEKHSTPDGQYDTTYRTDYVNRRVSVEVSPTHDAFARSLRAVSPDRCSRAGSIRSLRTNSTNSLRNSTSPEKHPKASPDRYRPTSPTKKSPTNRSSPDKHPETSTTDKKQVNKKRDETIITVVADRKIPKNEPYNTDTITRKKKITDDKITKNVLPRSRSTSPTSIASDIEFIRHTTEQITDLDIDETITKHDDTKITKQSEERPSSLKITTATKKSKKITERSPTSPLTDLTPTRDGPKPKEVHKKNLKSPTKDDSDKPPKYFAVSPKDDAPKDKVFKRTDTYEERCRQILGITDKNKATTDVLDKRTTRTKSPEKKPSPATSPIKESPKKPTSPTKIQEFPSQVKKSPEKSKPIASQDRKSPEKEHKPVQEFPSQIRKSPQRAPLEPYPEKTKPAKNAPSVQEFPAQVNKSPTREPLEPYPEKSKPTKDAPQVQEYPSHIRKTPQREPLEPYPEKTTPAKIAPSIQEFPAQVKKSPAREPLEPYPEKSKPNKDVPTVQEFPSQIRKSPQREPLEPYPEKTKPTTTGPSVQEFPSQVKKSPAHEPLEPYPEKTKPGKDAPSVQEFPAQIRNSPQREPLEPYPEKSKPVKDTPSVQEFPAHIRKSTQREPLEPYPEKSKPTKDAPSIHEFPSQVKTTQVREPLEPYPEKSKPTKYTPSVQEFPSQSRQSPQREPLEPYPGKTKQINEVRKSPEKEFPSQSPDRISLSDLPDTRKSPDRVSLTDIPRPKIEECQPSRKSPGRISLGDLPDKPTQINVFIGNEKVDTDITIAKYKDDSIKTPLGIPVKSTTKKTQTFIDKERVDTDITTTKHKSTVSSIKKRKDTRVTEEEIDEDESTSEEEFFDDDVSEEVVKEIIRSEDFTDDTQSKITKSTKTEPKEPTRSPHKQQPIKPRHPQTDDELVTVTKTTILESRVPVEEAVVTKKFIEALHHDEEMENYVRNTQKTTESNKTVKKSLPAKKPGDKSPIRKKQVENFINKERVDVEVTKNKSKVIPRHPSPVKKIPDHQSPDRAGIKRTTVTKKINVDEFTGETEYTDQYCKTTKVKQIPTVTTSKITTTTVRKQPTVKKTAVYNVGNVNDTDVDTSIVIKTFKIPNGETPKTTPSRAKPKESPKKKELRKPSPLIKRPQSPIKKTEDKLKQTKIVETDSQTKRTVSKIIEIKQTKPITRTVQKIEIQPKRHVVSTIINIKPKNKPETIIKPTDKTTYQTVTTTKTTKISPKITVTSKTNRAKPIQNGHVSDGDTDSETEFIDETHTHKITRTTNDRVTKSPRKTPVRGTAKPELLTPAKKCITTKSILIENAVADEREIIVDLKRSKSSREETPDRICPFPVPTNEDSGIPRYPDHITEPEDASRPKPQRISDVPLTESEDVVEFNRITEVTDKTKTVNRVQETDECLLSVNEKVSKFLNTAEQLTKPKDGYKRPHDDESFLSVSDKVNKFITTAEHMTTQRPKSPKNVDTNVDEGDESLLSVSEKVSHFISTAEKIKRPSKPKEVVPKVPRPEFEVDENIRSDECLLSVSDKVTKFITTADKLTTDYKKINKVEPKSRSQSPKKENMPAHDARSECPVEIDARRSASPEKSPVRKSPTRKSHEASPVPAESPSYRTPERRPSDLIAKKTDVAKTTRKDSFPLDATPKSSRRTSQDEPKTILSPTGRLRSTETIKKAKALFENINKEQEILKQRDTLSRPSVFDGKRKSETETKSKDVRTKLTYDEVTTLTSRSRETSPRNVPHYMTPIETTTTKVKKPSDVREPGHRSRPRSRDSSPEDGDVPHYMTPIERHHHKETTKTEKLIESAPKSRDSSPDQGDIPHYMTPLERHQHDTMTSTMRTEKTSDRYVNKTESVSTYTSRPRSRDSTPDGDIPHYMTPLDRQHARPSDGENHIRRSRPRSRDSSLGDEVPHYMAPLDRSVHHHVSETERIESVEHIGDRSRPRSRESTLDREVPHYMTPLDRTLRDRSPHVEQFDDAEPKATKFGVTLRRTDSGRVITSSRRKSSTVSVDKQITEVEIEEVYDLEYLEKLLETIVGYDIRKKIRAQIRIIKRMMEESELEVTTKQITKTTTSTRDVPKRSEKTPERPSKTPTEYQSSYTRKPSTDSKTVDRKTHQHTEWAQTGTSEETTEYQSSYRYNEKRTSSELKSERRSSSVETKPTRAKTPDKREKEKSASPVRKTAKPETPKVFQTELKKTKPLAKTVVNDKPDWVTQRTLRKVTETSTPVRKVSTKTTKKETRTSPAKEVKPTDVITSSYGVGPMDENGTPLFGLKALRAQNKSEKTKIQGTVIRSHYHVENGEEPVGEVSVTKFSTDPKDLGTEEVSKGEGVTSVTTTQKFGYKGTPSLKTIKGSKKQTEEDTQTTTKSSKVTRRGSVKEISQKFIENAVETLKSERQSSYPKAGLILRTSSFKDTGSSGTGSSREASPGAHEIRKTVTTTKSSTTTCGGDTFLSNKTKVTGVQDVLTRMKTEDVEEGESQEDRDARNLLNKFIGSQVILAGMETQVSRPSTGQARQTTTKVTTTTTSEGGHPKTVTRTFTHPITDELLETVWDEETLKLLLEQSTDYEDRRIIRARLRQVMAEQDACAELVAKASEDAAKAEQGSIQGESLLLPLLQGLLDAPESEQHVDSGTESGEDLRSGLIIEVQSALDKLTNSLKCSSSTISTERKASLLQLVNKLQAGLSNQITPSSSSSERRASFNGRFSKRRQRANRHTVGVTSEELEDARRLMEEIALRENIDQKPIVPLRKQLSEGAVASAPVKPTKQRVKPVKNLTAKPFAQSTNTSQSHSGTSSTVETPSETSELDYVLSSPEKSQTDLAEKQRPADPDPITQNVYRHSMSLEQSKPDVVRKRPLSEAISLDYSREVDLVSIQKAVTQAAAIKQLTQLKSDASDCTQDSETDDDPSTVKAAKRATANEFQSSIRAPQPDLILQANPVYSLPQSDDDDDDYTSQYNDKVNRFNSKKMRMKRANTIDIPKPLKYYECDDDDDSDNEADARRNSYLALRGPIRVGKPNVEKKVPEFEPKTDSDHKFMAFINKYNENTQVNKTSIWAGQKKSNWNSKFGNIKSSFENVSGKSGVNAARNFWKTADDAVSAGKVSHIGPKISKQSARNLQKMFEDKQKQTQQQKTSYKNVVTGSLKVDTKGFDPNKQFKVIAQLNSMNKFSHAPLSAFKPVKPAPIQPNDHQNSVKKQQLLSVSSNDSQRNTPETPLYLYSPKLTSPQNESPVSPWLAAKPAESRVLSIAVSKFENQQQEAPHTTHRRPSKDRIVIPPGLQQHNQVEKLSAPYLVKNLGQNNSVRKLSGQYDTLAGKDEPKTNPPKVYNAEYIISTQHYTNPQVYKQPTPQYKPYDDGYRETYSNQVRPDVYRNEPQQQYTSSYQFQPKPLQPNGAQYYAQHLQNQRPNAPPAPYNRVVKQHHARTHDYGIGPQQFSNQQSQQVVGNRVELAPNTMTHIYGVEPQRQVQQVVGNRMINQHQVVDQQLLKQQQGHVYLPNQNFQYHRGYVENIPPTNAHQQYDHGDRNCQIDYHVYKPETTWTDPNQIDHRVHNQSQYQSLDQMYQPPSSNEPLKIFDYPSPPVSPTPQGNYLRQTSQESLEEYNAVNSKVMSGPVSQQAVTVQGKSPKNRDQHDMESAFNLKATLQKFSEKSTTARKPTDVPLVALQKERSPPKAPTHLVVYNNVRNPHKPIPPNVCVNDKPMSLESLEINSRGESVVSSKFHIPVQAGRGITPAAKTGHALSKSESWHQICQATVPTSSKPSPRASPNSRTVSRSKSSHTLAVPKQYEAGMSKTEMLEKKKSIEAYFSVAISPSDAKKSSINRTRTAKKVSTQRQITEKVETTTKTFSEGPVTSQVTTRVATQQQVTKKPLSPFAKFRQLDKQNSLNSPPSTPKTPTGGGPLFKFTDPALNRSASTVKERLLQWCQMKTKEYENIQLDNFSTSWADGLAFCALVHHFLPDAFDYHALNPKNRRHNFTLAFQVADDKAGIAPLLDVDDMVATRRPDWKCVFTYVQSIYRRFKDED